MKKVKSIVMLAAALLAMATATYAVDSSPPPGGGSSNIVSTNQFNDQYQFQHVTGPGFAFAEGGDATAEGGDATAEGGQADALAYSGGSSSGAIANISTTSISNVKGRTPPLTSYPPYLPYWTHGGWGTLKAYFPTGPNGDGEVYERAFNPDDPDDMRELRSVVESLPHSGPLEALGGVLNGVGAVFGGPDNFHRGRGFEIASALVRDRRPRGKPLLVFVDSNVDRQFLREAGYVYVGKIGIEGVIDRNWDHVYDAVVAEALPWDVDILLISGGMKGVTVGSNTSFPGGAGGYSQLNYSVSLFGGFSSGITEGKGKALVSGEGYRYWPQAAYRRRIPQCLYDRIRVRPQAVQVSAQAAQEVPAVTGRPVRAPATAPSGQHVPDAATKEPSPGVKVSRELLEMAGFQAGQRIDHMVLR
jgi:hypothetical protein